MTHGSGRRRGETGAALIEMAIVLPLLVMLLLGIFATARGWQVHNVLDHAAREAARYGATVDPWDDTPGASDQEVENVALAEIQAASVPTGSLSFCIGKGPTPCGQPQVLDTDQVAVQITYPNYQLEFVFFSMTIDLHATAFARYEHE